MIISLIVLLIFLLLVVLVIMSYVKNFNTGNKAGCIMCLSLYTVFTGIIIIIGILSGSYSNYLDDRSFYDAVIEQYRGNITMYKDCAKINLNQKGTLTDFKNQGYQREISYKIDKLVHMIEKYNNSIIQKRIMKKNILFSWLIIEPDDDMKIISLITK